MRAQPWTSPNFDERKGIKPNLIIMHYTDMTSAQAALERLCDPASKVSAHYVIEEAGAVHNLVPEDKRAWHAGAAYWEGQSDINAHSIGVELVNPGHTNGYRPFTQAQIQKLISLCKSIRGKWPVAQANILAHSDIAPGRKQDPGPLFPWEKLAQAGIGLWPRPAEMDYQAAQDLIGNQQALHELLCAYGYNPQARFEDVVSAFHSHFYPEKFAGNSNPAQPDIASVARLLSLIRAGHEG